MVIKSKSSINIIISIAETLIDKILLCAELSRSK